MGKPAARIGDNAAATAPHCHMVHPWSPIPHPAIGAIIGPGVPTVMIGGMPAAVLGDNGTHAACCGPNTYMIAMGSATVMIGGKPAARMGDQTMHCGCFPGQIILGQPTVMIGG